MPDFSFKLLPDFLDKYKKVEPPFGFRDVAGNSLGEIIYSRTYSRLKENGNKETWVEAVERVTDATYTIQKNHVKENKLEWNDQKAQSSAKEFFDRLFNLKFTPPGRGLQQMGSEQVMGGNSASLQNCAVISTGDIERHDPGKVFEWAMLALMYGVGVGADMLGAKKNIEIRERTGTPIEYVVPDRREGWADSLRVLLNSYLRHNSPVIFDYSLIRPKGAPLVSFGGKASGPDPLVRLHATIERIFDARVGKTLDSETITDIFNLVGSCVIAGSTRRSAEIMMGEYSDEAFLDLKNPEVYPERNSYDPKSPGWAWASNNSINVPVGADYSKYVDRIASNGEPGLIWMDVAKTHGRMIDPPDDKDRRIAGFNPCSEQPLESQEMCTLVTVHLQNAESKEDFLRTLKFAFLYAKTVTLMPTPWTKTNSVMQRNRRIGLSLTGITDVVDRRGLPEILEWMEAGYEEVRRLDHIYSEWLCVRESNRVTTIKPEGCRLSSGLVTTKEGIFTLGEILKNHDVDKEWSSVSGLSSIQGDSIVRSYRNGQSEVLRVCLSNGMEVESTPEHKWMVRARHNGHKYEKGFSPKWVKTKDLVSGDVLDIMVGAYSGSENVALNGKVDLYCNVVKRHVPEKMSPDLGWLLGYLWGDGSMSPLSKRLRFTDQYIENIEKAKKILEVNFGYGGNIYSLSDRDAYSLEVRSSEIFDFFVNNGVWKYNNDGTLADIPLVVRQSSVETVLAFIAGLIDSDGCVHESKNGRTVTITSADAKFAKHLQDVALSVGVALGRSHNVGGENLQDEKSMWLMTVNGDCDESRFLLMMSHSIKGEVKFPHLEWNPIESGRRRFVFGKVKSIESIGVHDTYDVEVEDTHWYYAGAVKTHNSVSLLSGASPGIHWGPGGKFYLRAIRFGNNDPMLSLFRWANYRVEADLVSDDTSVVYFPMKTDSSRSEKEVSVFEKIGLAAKAQHHWSDNGVSVTVSFDPETEKHLLVPALRLHEGSLKSVSFLPMSNQAYPQQPYTQITEEEYESYKDTLMKIDFSAIYYGVDNLEAVGERFCSNDSCTI